MEHSLNIATGLSVEKIVQRVTRRNGMNHRDIVNMKHLDTGNLVTNIQIIMNTIVHVMNTGNPIRMNTRSRVIEKTDLDIDMMIDVIHMTDHSHAMTVEMENMNVEMKNMNVESTEDINLLSWNA